MLIHVSKRATGAETGIFRANQVNVLTAGALACLPSHDMNSRGID